MKVVFGGPDIVSIRLLQSWPGGLYFAPIVDNSNIELQTFLREYLFGNGSLAFEPVEHTGVMIRFRQITGLTPEQTTAVEIKRHIDYFTARVRNYAHIETLKPGHFEEAQNVGKCHAKRFIDPQLAIARVEWFKTLDHDGYYHGVYNKDYGFPPFDLTCDCYIEAKISGVDYLS